MEIKVEQGSIEKSTADTIIVNLFEGVQEPGGATGAVDRALGGALRDLIAAGDFKGKAREIAVVYPRGAIHGRRVILVGLGKREKLDLEGVRQAMAVACRRARELNARSVATVVHGSSEGGLSSMQAAQATVEGALLGCYRFDLLKKPDEPQNELQELHLVEFAEEKVEEVRQGAHLAEQIFLGVKLARDLVNLPPNMATPKKMAEVATQIAGEHDMKVFIGDRQWAAEQKMGAFLSVAKGAGEEPQFIVLEHKPSSAQAGTLVIVGKGITFDTGGISLKPGEKMEEMKCDMAGAAAALGTMKAIGLLNLPVHVVCLAPCTENMPDAHAYRPADVIFASNGKSIEIISTDAEGRLILADALVYAGRYKPQAVVDLATLTGACVIALGANVAAGLFTNDETLQQKLMESAAITYERLWPLPLYEDYSKKIKSDVADVKNSGGRQAGVGASAAFLKEFVSYPWAHIDMAGMALSDKEEGYILKGATGFGVRLLVQFLMRWVQSGS